MLEPAGNFNVLLKASQRVPDFGVWTAHSQLAMGEEN